jgi:hypothetical protein
MFFCFTLLAKLGSWRCQFIVIGCVTSVWGVLLWFLLPDNPIQASNLTKRSRIVAVEGLRSDRVGIENKAVKRDQIIETFTNTKTYMYMIMLFAVNLINGATTACGSILVLSFGVRILVPVSPLGLLSFVHLLNHTFHSMAANTACHTDKATTAGFVWAN